MGKLADRTREFIGFVIALLSIAPLGLALILSNAPPAVANSLGIGTVMFWFGIVGLLLGLFVMVNGMILFGVGVFQAV